MIKKSVKRKLKTVEYRRTLMQKKKQTKRLVFLAICILMFSLCLVIPISYSKFVSQSTANPDIKVAPWKYKINATDAAQSIHIDLADTIIENNYSMTDVIPGTKGKIELDIDFTGTKVASDYVVQLDTYNTKLPKNLKLYTDSSMVEEFNGFSGSVLLDDNTQKVTKTIYWEWKYTQEDETAEWANKELQIHLVIDLKQKLE